MEAIKAVNALRENKVENGLHISAFNHNGYNVEILDNNGQLSKKQFPQPAIAIQYINDYIRAVKPMQYDYLALVNTISYPPQLQIFGDVSKVKNKLPSGFI